MWGASRPWLPLSLRKWQWVGARGVELAVEAIPLEITLADLPVPRYSHRIHGQSTSNCKRLRLGSEIPASLAECITLPAALLPPVYDILTFVDVDGNNMGRVTIIRTISKGGGINLFQPNLS